MNSQIRELAAKIMDEKDITQGDLGEKMGIDRESVNRMLAGRTGKIPKNWAKMFEILGIEIEGRAVDNSEQHPVTHSPQSKAGK